MASGLVALLDDVAAIARGAAASLDDIGAGVAQAGAKAAGVVIDDAAVTPAYVNAFTPDRELPVIARIARGSLVNKLVILLPLALGLSALLPWAITPLLMLGGCYLCFEGAEKVIEGIMGHTAAQEDTAPASDAAAFEQARVSGAVRTDLILSAEIMAIAMAEVAGRPLFEQALILAVVGVGITVLVYGVVAIIVKLDDIGLALARRQDSGRGGAVAGTVGRALVLGTPKLLTVLALIGTAAMLWVGGGIVVHGADQLGWHGPAMLQHHLIDGTAARLAGWAGAALGWIAGAALAGAVGLMLGALVAGGAHVAGGIWHRRAG